MKSFITFLFIFLFANYTFSQHIYGSISYGIMNYRINYEDLKNSYSSYIEYMTPILSNQNLSFTQVDDNFSNNGTTGTLIFHLGFGQDGYSFVFTGINTKTSQSRDVRWSNGFGRNFTWKEARTETLLDIGFIGSKKIDLFASVGTNWNWSRMVSYYIYPDNSRTLTHEFSNNGVYKKYTVGLSFGGGIRYRFKNFLAIEGRYTFSKIGFGSIKKENDFGLSDNSIVKNPNYSYFPEDYLSPIAINANNELVPYFNRHSLTLAAIFYLKTKQK